jgi:hypothetical protein
LLYIINDILCLYLVALLLLPHDCRFHPYTAKVGGYDVPCDVGGPCRVQADGRLHSSTPAPSRLIARNYTNMKKNATTTTEIPIIDWLQPFD